MLLLVGGGSGAGVRRRRRPAVARALPASAPPVAAAPAVAPPRARGHEPGAIAAVVLGVVGLSVVALGATVGLLAARQPEQRTIAEPGLYVQRGAFVVSAPAPVGAVYQRPSLDASDPIFFQLVHKLDVRFGYRLRSAAPSSVAGTATLDAVLSDGNGWQRRFALAPSRRLRGAHVTVAGTLWLPSLLNAIRQFEMGTGEHYTAYHLELAPHVRVRGVVGGRLVRETFAPTLSYDLDALRLQLAHPPAGAGSNTLVRSRATAGSRVVASTLHLFGRRIGVAPARRLALVTLGAGLVAALAGGGFFLRRRRNDELAAIERRYGDLIVAVAAGARPQAPERRVATMEALVRIAERYDRLVLHEERDGLHSFLVDDAGLVYRYDAGCRGGGDDGDPAGTRPTAPAGSHQERRPVTYRLWHVLAVAAGAALVALIALAFSAANTVPASHAGRSQRPIVAQDIAPPQCAGMGLTTWSRTATAAPETTSSSARPSARR